MIQITSDFSQYADYPLVNSKFAVYICTYVDIERNLRDMPLLKGLKPSSLRYDPGCGFGNDGLLNSPREYNAPQIECEDGKLKINFQDYDRMVEALQDTNIKMMYVNAYNPICLQDEDGPVQGNLQLGMRSKWNTMPKDMQAWREINRLYAEHFKNLDQNSKYYEIWNEPDLNPVFFTGTMVQYFEIYRQGALGVREGDPEAKVGGPVLANTSVNDPKVAHASDWAEAFLDFVESEKLPLDFFSYHNYATPREIVSVMRDAIRNRPGMENVETIISEYNSYKPATRAFTVGGEIERHHLACRLLDDFEFFVAQPDISCVYWAQFNDPEVFGDMVDRCGLVSLDGKEKAAYHAFRIFSEMPADRVKVSISEKSVKGMASFDQKKACLVVWNLENESVKTRICLEHLPIESGKGKVYKIDAWRNSRIDNLNADSFQPCGEFSFAGGSLVLEDELLGESVYYICIEAQHGTAGESLVPSRIKRYYFDRYQTNYAEYDAEEGAVYLGMGKENAAVSKLELLFERDIVGIQVRVRDLEKKAPGSLVIQVEKIYSENVVREETIVLKASESPLPADFSHAVRGGELEDQGCAFSLPKGAVRTKIVCTMTGPNPGAKAKIKLDTCADS